jgi:uncharacterized protein
MPSTLNAPGVYIEELPSGVRPIVGVSTSDTAFVDWFPRGPVGVATRVSSFDDFARRFGGLHAQSTASYAVLQYFLNGGAVAWIVRIGLDDDTASTGVLNDDSATATINVTALEPGSWGDSLRIAVTEAPDSRVNLVVAEVNAQGDIVVREIHRNLENDAAAIMRGVTAASRVVKLEDNNASDDPPAAVTADATGAPADPDDYIPLTNGGDATVLDAAGAADDAAALTTAIGTALPALARIEPAVFNLLCIPVSATMGEALDDVVDAAAAFCEQRRAFMVVDTPLGDDSATGEAVASWFAGTDAPAASSCAGAYWPSVTMADPLARGAQRIVPSSGAIAGVFARTDATRGVWKAPAGIDATIRGAELAVKVNETDSAVLNPIGLNVLRTYPIVGNVVWGSRTLVGADLRADQWKYVPVRRTALYIEQSLDAGLSWVVFEPNDEPLWAQIRLNVGTFMQDLFRKGAFQGTTPRDAYFVRCDKDTTTQGDVDRGVVNILVGFAPLKPAEFVVIQIQQIAGQTV